MAHNAFMRIGVGSALMLVIVLAGCDGSASQTEMQVVKPESIEVDGGEWLREEWSREIESKVTAHFSRNPHLADNPSLSGEAVCYTNGSLRRVYWLFAMDGVSQWAMLEFKGSRAGNLREGRGAPFSKVSERIE